ncbi:MAG: carbon-nitrogen hydrolase family protein, partial [Acidimicrobiia bacterium]
VAAVQASPVVLDRTATTKKACDLVREAAGEGARLVVFPESFIPCYPDWVWRQRPWDDGESEWHVRFSEQSVTIPGPETQEICEAAAATGTYVAIGVTELSATRGTLYNSLVYIGPEGLLGVHRKLMPTGGERQVWGFGDGTDLDTHQTPFGRLGGLICWENYMPLARAAVYRNGVDVYVAPTWDNSDVWVPTLQHIAKESRAFVIGVTPYITGAHVPSDIPGRDDLYGGDDDLLSRGNTTVVDPFGRILAGPLVGEEGIVYADLDLNLIPSARRQFDPVGHYSRSDVLRLVVRDD